MKSLLFEWHPTKAKQNWQKHTISFEEATTVFSDPFALTFDDVKHSNNEYRWLIMGMTPTSKLLLVSYTERNDRIRLISARKLNKREQKIYQERGFNGWI